MSKFDFDFAFSFAGEEREYVEAVANELKRRGIKVFYDRDEEIELWGKDLPERFHHIYSEAAKYCVIFVSKQYVDKDWPRLERRGAIERAIREREEYILPARFDNTKLPGVPSTLGYIDLSSLSPFQFAEKLTDKLGLSRTASNKSLTPSFRLPQVQPPVFNPYNEALSFLGELLTEIKMRGEALAESGASISAFTNADRTCIRVVRSGETVYSLDAWMGGISGDSSLSFYGIRGENRSLSGSSTNAWGDIIWDSDKGYPVIDLTDFSLFAPVSGKSQSLTYSEMIDQIWDLIIDVLEGKQ